MSRVVCFRRSPLWTIAALVALVSFCFSTRITVSCFAADEQSSSSQSDSNDEEKAHDDADADKDDNASSDESNEATVTEDVEREVEIEPKVEKPAADAEAAKGDKEHAEPPKKEKRTIGATATVLEKQSNLLFRARVDTGAKSCSLHVEELSIDDEEEKWVDNIGKVVHFKVKNLNGESHYLDARIEGYVIIKTSGARERRYKVPLTLRWKGVEKTVMVTLNDRNGMEYPLLLGRNFLRGDFLVDVDVDHDD